MSCLVSFFIQRQQ